jgi:hypothetical protein
MFAAGSLQDVKSGLEEAFTKRPAWGHCPVRLVCLLFAPASSRIAKDELLPRWDDFHHRSGEDVDFFCAGYGAYWPAEWDRKQQSVATTTHPMGGKIEWLYSPRLFNRFVREVESTIRQWRYSGEVDLLLFNAHREADNSIELDLSSPIVLKIANMKKDKAIDSASELFETIFHYAPAQRADNPTWGYSDAMGLKEGRIWLIEWITSLLPAKLGNVWKRGRHYAVLS